MHNFNWIKEEEVEIGNNISIGAKVNIKEFQYDKRRSMHQLRWLLYQELLKNIGEHPNIQGAFYVRTWYDMPEYTNDIFLYGRIESIPITHTVINAATTKEEQLYNSKKLSFKDRLKVLFRGGL